LYDILNNNNQSITPKLDRVVRFVNFEWVTMYWGIVERIFEEEQAF
jgi:hypothetical protein